MNVAKIVRSLGHFSFPRTNVISGCRLARFSSESGSGDGVQWEVENPQYVPIPTYKPKQGESLSEQRARLLYQSRKRGMLENGLLLSNFAAAKLISLDSTLLKQYDLLINEPTNDWEIYYWITGSKPTPSEYDNELMRILQDYAKNKEKESRIRQPDLV